VGIGVPPCCSRGGARGCSDVDDSRRWSSRMRCGTASLSLRKYFRLRDDSRLRTPSPALRSPCSNQHRYQGKRLGRPLRRHRHRQSFRRQSERDLSLPRHWRRSRGHGGESERDLGLSRHGRGDRGVRRDDCVGDGGRGGGCAVSASASSDGDVEGGLRALEDWGIGYELRGGVIGRKGDDGDVVAA